MNIFFSTFIPGLGDVVHGQFKLILRDYQCLLLLDGLVLYKTSSPISAITEAAFLNNSFYLLEKFEELGRESIPEMIRSVLDVIQSRQFRTVGRFKPHGKTFRVITSRENELVSVKAQLLLGIESSISRLYSLKTNRAKPDIEFWFLYRSEGYGFFGIRLTRHRDYKKLLEKGELRPELAILLSMISEPTPDDVVLDPFCGSGAIPIARAKLPFRQIIAVDIDQNALNKLRKKIGAMILTRKSDALKLQDIDTESVDKIITDPPWGYYSNQTDLPLFYTRMIDAFYRVLKRNGLAVILTGRKEIFEEILEQCSDRFAIDKQYDVLVSGKKAGIYRISKG